METLRMDRLRDPEKDFHLLSNLVLSSDPPASTASILADVRNLGRIQFDALAKLAEKNHVVVRAFARLRELLKSDSNTDVPEWISDTADKERSRIQNALGFLDRVCRILEKNGCTVTVIKSLDHWPDLGSDLDLYTDSDPSHLVNLMQTEFNAKIDDRSWGDRLANKWNFVVPGLPELVEVHVRRLGQTGEQTSLTASLLQRTRTINIGEHSFRVLAPEDRVIVSTLQRMYRHFYIRLCDVMDNAILLESGCVDFTRLLSLGTSAGIWEGIATYLAIISGYVEAFRGHDITLPACVTGSARFGIGQVFYRRDFLRVPILPYSVSLYAAELRELVRRGELRNSLRLSLLPGLATAAALELKLTGSDKGIW
jgi:Uncharacterised nucleotidyltransferase